MNVKTKILLSLMHNNNYFTNLEEAEKLARLLPDGHELTVFYAEEKEEGDLYNKLFMDLRFVYLEYDEYIKNGCDKERAFELVKED